MTGGANSKRVAARDPRTNTGIAASSGRSSDSIMPAIGATTSGATAHRPDAPSSSHWTLPATRPGRESRPPSHAPNASATSKTPITLVQTYALSPNHGASRRTATSSRDITAKPARPATEIAVTARIAAPDVAPPPLAGESRPVTDRSCSCRRRSPRGRPSTHPGSEPIPLPSWGRRSCTSASPSTSGPPC